MNIGYAILGFIVMYYFVKMNFDSSIFTRSLWGLFLAIAIYLI